MADRDAFGREKTEDTLDGLGWTTGGSITPPGPTAANTPSPAPVSPSASATPAAPPMQPLSAGTPVGPPRSTSPAWSSSSPSWQPSGASFSGALPRVIIAVVVLGSVAAFLIPAIFTANKAVHVFRSFTVPNFTTSTPSVPNPATPVTPAKPATPAGSLVRPASFARALASIERGHYGRLRLLRVAPDRIDAQTVTAGGRLRSVQVPAGGRASVLSTSPPGFPQGNVVKLSAIDRKAPARLATGVRTRTGSAIDYAATVSIGGATTWTVVAKNGDQFIADAHGRITRRID